MDTCSHKFIILVEILHLCLYLYDC